MVEGSGAGLSLRGLGQRVRASQNKCALGNPLESPIDI